MKDFKQQAEMLASMFALAGLISGGKTKDVPVDVAVQLGKELVECFYSDGIAALKPKVKK